MMQIRLDTKWIRCEGAKTTESVCSLCHIPQRCTHHLGYTKLLFRWPVDAALGTVNSVTWFRNQHGALGRVRISNKYTSSRGTVRSRVAHSASTFEQMGAIQLILSEVGESNAP